MDSSLRRASRVSGQRRQSLYYKRKRLNEDELIQGELNRLSILQVNWGFGLMYGKLRLEGSIWGKKLVYRNYQTILGYKR